MLLPMDKLSLRLNDSNRRQSPDTKKEYVVLVSTGSFNPPTFMHLRCFELARDALNSEGYCVIGGYMSPVNDAYKKKASQSSYQRSLTVLSRIRTSLSESGLVRSGSLKVMLVCGSDLLESFSIPGAWIPDQVRSICQDFGLVCIRRDGQDVEKVISNDNILNKYKSNIRVVDEVVPNGISSTRLRECISRGLSVKYLTVDDVINYIKQHHLYIQQNDDDFPAVQY